MQWTSFIISLLGTAALLGGINYFLLDSLELQRHSGLAYGSIAFFVLLCALIFWLAKMASQSKDKYAFVRLIMSNMMIKMLLAVAIIVVYTRVVDIETNLFILPFFVTYIGFTIFETVFLFRLSKLGTL